MKRVFAKHLFFSAVLFGVGIAIIITETIDHMIIDHTPYSLPTVGLYCLHGENVIAPSYTPTLIHWTKIAMRCGVLNFLCVIACF